MRSRKVFMLLFLAIIILGNHGQVLWANEVTFETEVGLGGAAVYERYIPLTIKVQGDGHFSGKVHIVIEGSPADYWKDFSVGDGEVKTIKIPIWYSTNMSDIIEVDVLNQSNIIVAQQTVDIANEVKKYKNELLIGALSDDQGQLPYFSGIELDDYVNVYSTQKIVLEAEDIDEDPKNLDMIDFMVISDYDTTTLSPEQITTIEKWVGQGGLLIIATGVDGNMCLNGFDQDFIPYSAGDISQRTINIENENLTFKLADLQDQREEQETSFINNWQIYKVLTYGAGKILVARWDLSLEATKTRVLREMWKKILEEENIKIRGREYYPLSREDFEFLRGIERDYLPKPIILVSILLVYGVVLGIGSYVLLKRKGKKEYIWLVAPMLSIIVTFILAQFIHSISYIVKQIDITNVQVNGNAAQTSYMVVLNTNATNCKMAETDVASFRYIDRYQSKGTQQEQHIGYKENKLQYEAKDCGLFDTIAVVTNPKKVEDPPYEAKLYEEDFDYRVSFKNNSHKNIKRLLIQWGEKVWDCNELDIGEKIDINLEEARYTYLGYIENNFSSESELADLWSVVFSYRYTCNQEKRPVYIAITESDEKLIDFGREYNTDYHYAICIGEIPTLQ